MGKKYRRREFLNQLGLGCASVGATTLLNGITNMGLINSAVAANTNHSFFQQPTNDYKALVCILMSGGNDSFNTLIPRGDSEYNEYAVARTNVAIPQADLLPINPLTSDGKLYGLHPNLPKIQTLFENENLAFIANIGALIRPTTMTDFINGIEVPRGIGSHRHFQQHWQTAFPADSDYDNGWGGRLADILSYANTNESISMNISLSGTNRFQLGNSVTPYAVDANGGGAVLLNGSSDNDIYEVLKRQTLDNLLEVNYSNLLDQAYNGTIKKSKESSFEFVSALSNTNLNTSFESHQFSANLEMIAKIISVRDTLGFQRQTFFVNFGGFDTHGGVQKHNNLLGHVDDALDAFYNSLVELGLENNVTTFTISDFGRKLVSNGNGTDHAWGGNVMVMGGDVKGKNIYGQYPDLYIGNPLDYNTGRLIPTTGCDPYYAELALWFGASTTDLPQILPNINNFWTPTAGSYPIGFMN